MTKKEYDNIFCESKICDRLSFRGLLSARFQFDNLNFSIGGSSNQAQFRMAKEYFGSKLFQQHQQQYKKIKVIWGITSTSRNEFYFNKAGTRQNFFYSKASMISKLMLIDHYDHDHEVEQLSFDIRFWNLFFEKNNVDIIWVDTFNHHDYPDPDTEILGKDYQFVAGDSWPSWHDYLYHSELVDSVILQEINDSQRWNFYKHKTIDYCFLHSGTRPRDLLSQLAIQAGWQAQEDQYHFSLWAADSQRINLLKNQNQMLKDLKLKIKSFQLFLHTNYQKKFYKM
jgi:hypothetical protein